MSEMSLEIDLAFDAGGDRVEVDGVRRIGFHTIAAAARSPRALFGLLGGARCDTVVVREDGLPLSGVQVVVMVLIGLIPARRWIFGEDRESALSRVEFLIAAL